SSWNRNDDLSPSRSYSRRVGKAADWLREERRNVLGHWTAFCVECGAARRWFEDSEHAVPEACSFGGAILRRCPACQAPFSEPFAGSPASHWLNWSPPAGMALDDHVVPPSVDFATSTVDAASLPFMYEQYSEVPNAPHDG